MSLSLYHTWRQHIWTGDLLEWSSTTALGWLIRKFTGQDVNHSSLVVRYTSFDQERVYILEAVAFGVYPNFLSRRLEAHKGQVYWLQLVPEYDGLRPDIAREAMKYVGIKYDYRSLIRQAVSRVSAEASAFFCSELCYQAGLEAGLPIKQAYAPRPGEFSCLDVYKPRIQIY
jgi:hypothetical protein